MPAQLVLDTVTTQVRIRVNKGEDFTITVPVLDSANVVVSLASGWSAVAQVHDATGLLLYTWSSAASNLTTTAAGVVLQFVAAQTVLWTWQDGLFECDVTSPAAARGIVAQGPFTALNRLVQP